MHDRWLIIICNLFKKITIRINVLKDIITRYASMTGHHVERRFGWDCHGLPIEYEIDKEFEIKGKKDYLTVILISYLDGNWKLQQGMQKYCDAIFQSVGINCTKNGKMDRF